MHTIDEREPSGVMRSNSLSDGSALEVQQKILVPGEEFFS